MARDVERGTWWEFRREKEEGVEVRQQRGGEDQKVGNKQEEGCFSAIISVSTRIGWQGSLYWQPPPYVKAECGLFRDRPCFVS